MRDLQALTFVNTEELLRAGLTTEILKSGIIHVYKIIDLIDEQLLANDTPRLSGIVELNNLSSILGNLLATGIVKASAGVFKKNKPHTYPDLVASAPNAKDIEIKIAIERNKPKGHLSKAGYYLTFRYVLGDENGIYKRGERKDVVWIWEVRFGWLDEHHFSESNTPGDSGKTATFTSQGMEQLAVIFCDLERCPYSPKGKVYKAYLALYS